MVGLAWVERVCGGGSTAGVSSSEFKRGGDAILGRGVEELAKERREKKEGVLLVLMRAKGEGAASNPCCPRRRRGGGRWGVLGCMACMHQASGAAWVAAGTFQATCGGQRNARGGPGATQRGGRAAHGTGGEKQSREAG